MTNSNGQGGSALSLDQRKRAARLAAKAILAQCDPAAGHKVAERIRPNIPPGAVVAGFLPIGRELDLAGLLTSLRAAGHVVALPRTPPRGQPLTFNSWSEGDALIREPFGTLASCGPPVQPAVLLVPLLAFDRRGRRLGYGGGYYDRTLAAMPAVLAIGCAYAALEMPEVPAGSTDQRLHHIATETEFITIKGRPCASSS